VPGWKHDVSSPTPYPIPEQRIVDESDSDRRSRAEAANQILTQRNAQLYQALALVDAGFYFIDFSKEPTEVWWSDEIYAMFGLQPGAIEPSREAWLAIVHPEDRAETARHWDRGFSTAVPVDLEYRIVRQSDGEIRWIRSRREFERGPGNVLTRGVGILVDISATRLAEATRADAQPAIVEAMEVALATHARYRLFFEGAADPVLVLDEQGNITDANAAASRLTGFSKSELTRMSVGELVIGLDGAPLDIALFGGAADWRGEHYLRRKAIPSIPVESHVSLANIGPKTVRSMSLRDLSERRLFELTHQDLLDSLSHDLKTPLATIQANAQLAERQLAKADPPFIGAAASLDNIKRAVHQMAQQLDELLEVARLRSGTRLDLRLEDCDLVELANAVVDEVRKSTEAHTITVQCECAELVVSCDSDRMRRVLRNLLSNAIKYSPESGEIVVTLETVHDDHAWAQIVVEDHGVGIPADEIDQIFERFRRGSNAFDIAGGSGLGLAGVRHILQEHRGTITVESTVGLGSRFTLRLPLNATSVED
jgi:PAS domain S-box-containing protein